MLASIPLNFFIQNIFASNDTGREIKLFLRINYSEFFQLLIRRHNQKFRSEYD